MRNSDDTHSTDHGRMADHGRSSDHARYDREDGYRDDRYIAPNYDSHYDEGEDHVGFVNIIDMDIPFFQLVWLIFKIFLAAIVAASMIAFIAMLMSWVLSLPVVQNILPSDTSWVGDLLNPTES